MVSVFLPTRKGSERVLNKNTRDFAGVKGGLLQCKLSQLLNIDNVDEVVLSTNDEACIQVANSFADNPKLKVVVRPENLALSSTSLIDLVDYVPSVCKYENILWTHVTSPFVGANDYKLIVETYFEKLNLGYDSLMTIKPIRNFIWDKEINDIINRVTKEKWPRTQDLKVFFEVDSAAFMSSKTLYKKFRDRIGSNPYLFEMENIKSLDIDWEEDFKIAEFIFKGLNG